MAAHVNTAIAIIRGMIVHVSSSLRLPAIGFERSAREPRRYLIEKKRTAIATINDRKAKALYDELDRTSFWKPHADKDSRSRMNVTFKLPSEELDKLFVKESTAAGFDGLKGHRSVGGLRASIYNAFPEQGIADLVSFMKEFEQKNG